MLPHIQQEANDMLIVLFTTCADIRIPLACCPCNVVRLGVPSPRIPVTKTMYLFPYQVDAMIPDCATVPW
jgi:hypothetical protein